MKRKTHSTPIGTVFKLLNIKYEIVGATVNLDEVFRKDMDAFGKPYYQLRGFFTCESCGEITERQILYIYLKVQNGIIPYVLCNSCLHQRSVVTSKLVAEKRWKEAGFVRLVDRLNDIHDYWNYEKNILSLEEIFLKDVTGKKGLLRFTTVHLYCYLCEGECERSIRTLLNNKYNTSHCWVLCDKCKSQSRTSKGEILCLLLSEYCFENFGLSYEFQHRRKGLVSKDGNPLAFDFAFFTSEGAVAFILEIQGGLHSEKHFAETDEAFHERVERDVIKRDFCREYGLELIEMDYNSPSKKELRRIQATFTKLLRDQGLIPNNPQIPDFTEYAFYITLEYQKLNANTITIKKLITYVMEGKRIGDLTDIEFIRELFLSDKQTKTAYNRAILPEVTYLLKNTDHSIKEISQITKMSKTVIRRINNGEIYSQHTHASREEPLKTMKRSRIDVSTIWEIVRDLKETNLSFREIGKRRGVSESVPKAINDGRRYTKYSGASIERPIRPPQRNGEQQVLAIVELLRGTTWTQEKIANYAGVTKAVVQKINTGYNHSNITGASGQEPIRKK
jgi:hypothetical protein